MHIRRFSRGASFALLGLLVAAATVCGAGDFDPALHAKAVAYQDWIRQWHTPGLGGMSPSVRFADENRDEVTCLHGIGDSLIWTGMYLGSQALRFMATGEDEAREEVHRIATYCDLAMESTQTPGYLPRYVGPDELPYNCGVQPGNSWRVEGEGDWEGYFWIDHTSRDQYSGWMWGMGLAYQALDTGDPDDEAMREVIREDINAVIQMLEDNRWHITDQNGEWTGNDAHWIGPGKRLGWLIVAATVNGDDPHYWNLLDQQFIEWEFALPIDIFAGLNKYSEYYGNNLRHLDLAGIFRWWPDRGRLLAWWDVHQRMNRPYVENTHNAWYDAVHVAGCLRLGVCTPDEFDAVAADVYQGLSEFLEVPNTLIAVTPPETPLDPFSVWMDELLEQYPDLRDIIKIHPQTAEAHYVRDRCWDDMIWQRSPFHISCNQAVDPTYAKAGFDYLVSYWMAVTYGLIPGPGPFEDEPLDSNETADGSFTGDEDEPQPADDAGDDDDDSASSSDDESGCS